MVVVGTAATDHWCKIPFSVPGRSLPSIPRLLPFSTEGIESISGKGRELCHCVMAKSSHSTLQPLLIQFVLPGSALQCWEPASRLSIVGPVQSSSAIADQPLLPSLDTPLSRL